jgi:hypothetical protein
MVRPGWLYPWNKEFLYMNFHQGTEVQINILTIPSAFISKASTTFPIEQNGLGISYIGRYIKVHPTFPLPRVGVYCLLSLYLKHIHTLALTGIAA